MNPDLDTLATRLCVTIDIRHAHAHAHLRPRFPFLPAHPGLSSEAEAGVEEATPRPGPVVGGVRGRGTATDGAPRGVGSARSQRKHPDEIISTSLV